MYIFFSRSFSLFGGLGAGTGRGPPVPLALGRSGRGGKFERAALFRAEDDP